VSSSKRNGNSTTGSRPNAQNIKKILLKKRIIEIFYKEGLKTIAELCETTNNSVPSITNIMNEMNSEGWVNNFGIGESKGGRKPAIYGLNPRAGLIAAIDLSRKDSRIGVFNLHNEQVSDILEINDGLDTTDNILSILKKEMENLWKKNSIQKKEILGLGVTIPGLIDIKKGVSYSYPIFGNKPLKEVFGKQFGLPSTIEHDTKAMAVGESWFGLARDKSDVLFINIGSGIGLGIIINGKLYQGHSGFSGEFGHIQMDPDGHLCYCGKIGCLETIASGTALVKKARQMIREGKNSIISAKVDNKLEAIKLKTIVEAANQGDLFAIELIEEAGEYLAKGMSILIHLFNPEAIIIGGEMSEAGNLVTDPVQQKLNKYTMLRLKQDTTVLVSDLKEAAGLYGTLPIVVDSMLSRYFGNGAHGLNNGSEPHNGAS